jgi:hypothetical protein
MNPDNVIPYQRFLIAQAQKELNDAKELIYEGQRITWDEFFQLACKRSIAVESTEATIPGNDAA